MYGLVNKAVRDLIISGYGSDKWESIRRRAGVHTGSFVCMRSYDDDITYRLVAAASEELGASEEALLEAFGEHWTQFTAQEGYATLLSISGDNIPDFLANLNHLHERVGAAMPELRPPSFACQILSERELELSYTSERNGLTSMMMGLLKGISTMFDTPVRVTITARRDRGAPFDQFRVEHGDWLIGLEGVVMPRSTTLAK